MTKGELFKILNEWPDETEIMINVARVYEDFDIEMDGYEWHDFKAYGMSESERASNPVGDRSTFTTLEVLPEITGC